MKRQTAKTDPMIRGPVYFRDISQFFNVGVDYLFCRASTLGFKRSKDLEPFTKANATLLLERTGLPKDRIASFIAQRDFSQTLPQRQGQKGPTYRDRTCVDAHTEHPTWHVDMPSLPLILGTSNEKHDSPTFNETKDEIKIYTYQEQREIMIRLLRKQIAENRVEPILARVMKAHAREQYYREKAKQELKLGNDITAYLRDSQAANYRFKAQCHEEHAREIDDYARLLKLWTSLPVWNGDQSRAAIENFCRDTREGRTLLAYSLRNPNGLRYGDTCFTFLRDHIADLFKVLEALIMQGCLPAAKAYIDATMLATRRLNDLTQTKTTVMQRLFKGFTEWPVLESPHKCFRVYPGINLSKLTGHLNLALHERAQWDPRDPATAVAIRLLEHVESYQFMCRHWQEICNCKVRDVKQTLAREVLRLPDFSKKTARPWWKVAKQCFREEYPNPYNVPELRGLVYLSQMKPADLRAKVRKLPPSTRNAYIVRNIGGKFISLAGRRRGLLSKNNVLFDSSDPTNRHEISLDDKLDVVKRALRGTW